MENVPFYQVFTAYEAKQDKEQEDDLNKMRSMYPKAARRVLREVQEECDRLEYRDSFMFHENPDRVMVDALSGKIYNRLLNINMEEKAMKAQSFLGPKPEFLPPWERPLSPPDYSIPFPPGPGAPFERGDYNEKGEPDWLRQLINVMLLEEMSRRRQRYRQRGLWN